MAVTQQFTTADIPEYRRLLAVARTEDDYRERGRRWLELADWLKAHGLQHDADHYYGLADICLA